ncbi:hypothetical protein [Flavivirga aquimarina]
MSCFFCSSTYHRNHSPCYWKIKKNLHK